MSVRWVAQSQRGDEWHVAMAARQQRGDEWHVAAAARQQRNSSGTWQPQHDSSATATAAQRHRGRNVAASGYTAAIAACGGIHPKI